MLKMKNTNKFSLLIIVGLISVSLFLVACDAASDPVETLSVLPTEASEAPVETETRDDSPVAGPSIDEVTDNTAGTVADTQLAVATAEDNSYNGQYRFADRSEHVSDPETAAEISPVEEEGLTYMREEEKLARDVYLALYDQWSLPVFQNIAGSEQAHMDSVLMLLDQYGLTDPAAGKDAGEFTNSPFQSLYEQLVGQGRLSLADALTVGATIEELDIVDLEERLTQTDNEYIIRVYNNLLAGSKNHLRAFVTNLERRTGEVYQPTYLDQDAYQAIMNSASGRGGGNNGGYGGGNGWGGNGGNSNGRRNGQGGNA